MAMNRNQMMRQAKKMQEQLLAAQEEAKKVETTASAGGGMVKATVTGDMRVTALEINPDALDPEDVEFLQDMIIAAVNDALNSAEASAAQQLSSLTAGFNIPGLF